MVGVTRRPGIGSWYFPYPITAAASAAWNERKGLAAGEQADDEVSRCDRCELPTDPYDLQVIHNDEALCDTCAKALLGDVHIDGAA